jgi:DNA-binding NarL/FixJ family response regulator
MAATFGRTSRFIFREKRAELGTSSVRVLIVDDNAPWRHFFATKLKEQGLQIIAEVADGLQAVEEARELQPDLIFLDIGLPTLNGIEVARRIRKVSPKSKILFTSEESSVDVVQEALGTGARGYVVKTDAGGELLKAVDAVLRGEQFVGKRYSGHDFVGPSAAGALDELQIRTPLPQIYPDPEIAHRHDVGFYSDDAHLLHDLTRFVGAALTSGNAAIVVATQSHREKLLPRLQAHGFNIATSIDQGRYIALDTADLLSAIMFNDMPDPDRFFPLLGDLILTASKAGKGKQGRVAIFSECAPLLWAQGNAEAAIQLEKLGSQLAKISGLDILCGYSLSIAKGGMEDHIFQEICAEHRAVFSR